MGARVAHEVDAASLPGGAQHLGHRRLDALVGVRDHQLHSAQTAPRELAQELGPDRLGFRSADLHAQDLAPAVAINADSHDGGHRNDAATPANLEVGRIDPQIGPVAFNGAIEEGFDLAVDLLA